MLWRLIMAVILAGTAGWSFYHYHYLGQDTTEGKAAALIEPLMLPGFVVGVTAATLIIGAVVDNKNVAPALARTFFGLFLQISLYFLVLLCLLPLLRRRIGARACATLWILPNLMYVLTYARSGALMKPLFLFPLPGVEMQRMLVAVWLVGFGAVVLWQIGSHLYFRRKLLKAARPVELESPKTKDIYLRERSRCEQKYSIPLFISHEIQTPVTVGCFRSTVVMVLPRKEYTPEELSLIFRHEFQHVHRADMRTKVFLAFCAAMCWFNPLMWIARKKASEDLELSCDEEVLKGTDEATRRKYAELLLRTAGDSRGFSTCLSAGAKSLRYRLKNVVTPTRRTSGTLCVVMAVFALFMGMEAVAFAEPAGSVKELIFSHYPEGTVIDRISADGDWEGLRGGRNVYVWQEEKLMEYLGSLRVRRVYYDGYESGDGRSLYLDMETGILEEYGEVQSGLEVWNYLTLSDGLLRANIPYDGNGNSLPYLVEDEIDWDYISTLLDFDASEPDADTEVPRWMQAEFSGQGLEEKICLDLSGVLLSWVKNGRETSFRAEGLLGDPGGLYGYSDLAEVKLLFPYEPADYEVLVRNWEKTEGYSIPGDQLEEDVLPLAPYSAHYIVYATFSPEENVSYRLAYAFEIELASK